MIQAYIVCGCYLSPGEPHDSFACAEEFGGEHLIYAESPAQALDLAAQAYDETHVERDTDGSPLGRVRHCYGLGDVSARAPGIERDEAVLRAAGWRFVDDPRCEECLEYLDEESGCTDCGFCFDCRKYLGDEIEPCSWCGEGVADEEGEEATT